MSVRLSGMYGLLFLFVAAVMTVQWMQWRVRQLPAVEWPEVAAASQDVRRQFKEDQVSTQAYEVGSYVTVSFPPYSRWRGQEWAVEAQLEGQYRGVDFRVQVSELGPLANDLHDVDQASWLPRVPNWDLIGWEQPTIGRLVREGPCLYVEGERRVSDRVLLAFVPRPEAVTYDLATEELLYFGKRVPLGTEVEFWSDTISPAMLMLPPPDECDTSVVRVAAALSGWPE